MYHRADEIARQLRIRLAESLQKPGLALPQIAVLAATRTVVTPKHMATVTALGFFLRQARRGGTAHDKHLEAAPTAMGRLGSLFYLRHYSEGRNHSRLSWDEV